MNRIWDQGKGHDGNESNSTYSLFKLYLSFLKVRSVAKVAEFTGKSYGTIYNKYNRFNWLKRAEAFDRWAEEGNDISIYMVDVPEPPEEPKPLPVTREYRSSRPAKVVDAQVVNERLEELAGLVHQEKMKEFATAYEQRGKDVFEKGKDILGLVNYYILRIKASGDRQAQLLDQSDYGSYLKECLATDALVTQYCKLWGAFQIADSRARTDWGDAIGVGQLLEAMFQQVQE